MERTVTVLRTILENGRITQRELGRACRAALGTVNSILRGAQKDGLLRKEGGEYRVTERGLAFLEPYRVEKAVIMAAGFGSRFVPLTLETPKGLLEVLGEPMIERQIRQLQEAGITDITIIVGYMKERFEYLIDRYGVRLRYNPEFTDKNTLASLYHAADILEGANAYVLSSDNWLRENLYHAYEPRAWYASEHADGPTSEWVLETDSRGKITDTWPGGTDCDYMYGPAYFSKEFSAAFLPVLRTYYRLPGTENFYWEHVLMELLNGRAEKRLAAFGGGASGNEISAGGTSADGTSGGGISAGGAFTHGAFTHGTFTHGAFIGKKPEIWINRQEPGIIYEFENLEELRRFDPRYENDSGSAAMQLVSRVLSVPESEIRRIRCLKAGMTNHSWLFEVRGVSYICRIPGEGTERLISRKQEAAVYEAVRPLDITEELVWLDPDSGYKISRFYENSRNADPQSAEDMGQCMRLLRKMHESGVRVEHAFDIGKYIGLYERLILEESGEKETAEQMETGTAAPEAPGRALAAAVPFADYPEQRKEKDRLIGWLAEQQRPVTLAHIDSVADNFIFVPGPGGKQELRLIDWEYAGMADPFIDIAMCAIYSFMTEEELRGLAAQYLGRQASLQELRILYAYAALGGLLWSLWGIYKEKLGVQFTDYTIRMYRYYKEYAARWRNGDEKLV